MASRVRRTWRESAHRTDALAASLMRNVLERIDGGTQMSLVLGAVLRGIRHAEEDGQLLVPLNLLNHAASHAGGGVVVVDRNDRRAQSRKVALDSRGRRVRERVVGAV